MRPAAGATEIKIQIEREEEIGFQSGLDGILYLIHGKRKKIAKFTEKNGKKFFSQIPLAKCCGEHIIVFRMLLAIFFCVD
jgi:hypothetical protein